LSTIASMMPCTFDLCRCRTVLALTAILGSDCCDCECLCALLNRFVRQTKSEVPFRRLLL
jgi:hypothetical protein